MIRNYFKIAWRNLWMSKTFTALNLGALSISLAVCLVIYFWINDELSYDISGENADRVFRVALKLETNNQPVKEFAVTAAPLAPALLKDYSEIEKVVRITSDNPLINVQDQRFFTTKFLYADSTFFDVFGYPLVKGDPHSVLNDVNSVVITESMAKKYFGEKDPVGQFITMNDTVPLKVTGIAKDHSAQNHFQFEIVVSMKIYERQIGAASMSNWWFDNFYTYVLLKDASSASALNTKISDIIDRYNGKQNKEFGLKGTHYLQALKDIHLYSDLRSEINPNGSIKSIRIFIWIAVFLLLVACINYVNLTTATSFRRAKEIGMKKVSGASYTNLIVQFLGESLLISLLAWILAVALSGALVPLFNKLADTQINSGYQFSLPFILRLLASIMLLGIVAGSFPALYLSRIKPMATFRKTFLRTESALSLRKVLVVFQFTITVILIIATIVALQQLKFMKSQDLGFDKEQVLNIPLRNESESVAKERLKNELVKNAGIIAAATSSSTPGGRLSNITVLPEGLTQDRSQTMGTLVIDYDFINTYKLKIVAGRGFSKEYGNDSSAFLLNETAVRELGWGKPEKAIGKGFNWGLGKEGRIVGVVKDFHFNSLHQKVQPLVMHIQPSWFWYGSASVRIDTKNAKAAIQSIESSWNKILPGHPFEYTFVDEDYDNQYKTEQRLGKLSILFSGLIIFISCMGLFGLTMVAVSQRIKEIGVRKVLGASAARITAILTKDFIKLVAVAILIASPVAWWLMNQWLQDFAYRINIHWWVFGVAGLLALSIAVITVSVQSVKAALANPVKSLRTE